MLWLFALLAVTFVVMAPGWLLYWLARLAYGNSPQQQAQTGPSASEGAAYAAWQAAHFVTRIFGH